MPYGRSAGPRPTTRSSTRWPVTPLESQRDSRRGNRGAPHHHRDAHRRAHLPRGDRARRALELGRASSRGPPPRTQPRILSAMPALNLRERVALLEREGELVRVAAEVAPYLEVTEIVDRTVKRGGPALLFERPKGSAHPLLINQFGTERRMCLAFGVDRLDDVAARLADVLELQPPQGLVDKVKGLKKLKSIADSMPKSVRSGPVHDVVLTGEEVDLTRLPIQTCWPGDAAPFITLPAVTPNGPRNSTRNLCMYPLQLVDRAGTLRHREINKDGQPRSLPTARTLPLP